MAPIWPWTLNNDKYFAGNKDLPLRLKFWSIFSTTTCYRDIRLPENRKCTEWPQTELEHLSIKSTPGDPNCGPFYSTISSFLVTSCTKSSKIGNAPNAPKLNLNAWQSIFKSTLYTLNAYPWGPNFGPFHCTISRFREATCTRSSKIGKAPNEPNWTWTLNSQKYSIYTKYLHVRPKFCSVSFYG